MSGPDREQAALELLAPDELDRWRRLRPGGARYSFLTGRVLLRSALSLYADIPADAWRFAAEPLGRPLVATPTPAPAISFNVSHTNDLVACAIAGSARVGVDAEHLGRRAPLAVANRCFADDERHRLLAVPDGARNSLFLAHWTLKEAYAKARGAGITLGLARVAFEISPGEPPVARFAPDLHDDPARWHFELLRPTAEHIVGLCCRKERGHPPRITLRWAETLPLTRTARPA